MRDQKIRSKDEKLVLSPSHETRDVYLSGLAVGAMSIVMAAAFATVGGLAYASFRGEVELAPGSAPAIMGRSPVADELREGPDLPSIGRPAPLVASLTPVESVDDLYSSEILQQAKTPFEDQPSVSIEPNDEVELPEASPVATETATVRDIRAGGYVVQLGAFDTEEAATAEWADISGGLDELLRGKAHDIERADLGELGVFYRLRVGPFDASQSAREWCDRLVAQGQDCLAMGL